MKKLSRNQELLNNYSNLDLKKLPEEIRKSGFDYKLIKRTNAKCIYSQSIGDQILAYEVFKTKIKPHKAIMQRMKDSMGTSNNVENLHEYREAFPLDEEFGARAWCCKGLDRANEVYEGLEC